MAVGLTLLAVLAVISMARFAHPDGPRDVARVLGRMGNPPGWSTYALIAAAFLPLALRRRVPIAVLAVTSVAAALYDRLPNPPAFVLVGPLIALYTVGTLWDRRTLLFAGSSAALVAAGISVRSFTGTRWLADIVPLLAVYAVAASFGDATRTRRAYVREVEQRALEAERTRDEVARRRVEEERLRIARELHDVTAHSLSIIAVQAGAAEKVVERDPQSARTALEAIRLTSKNSLEELRAMLGVLRGEDDDAPLAPAGRLARLPELVASVESSGLSVTLDVDAELGDVPAFADVSAYRIVQEALTNVVRHAKAASVRVAIGRDDDALAIEVTDDGRVDASGTATEGHGIAGMRERVAALGGSFEAGPRPGGGFRVFARLPLTRGA